VTRRESGGDLLQGKRVDTKKSRSSKRNRGKVPRATIKGIRSRVWEGDHCREREGQKKKKGTTV